MTTKPKVGLLPLYLKLYDDMWPEMRKRVDGFRQQIATALEERGLEVSAAPVCRLEPEFNAAIENFEKAGMDAIVTLHMAYSPSLESSAALAATRLPIIVLDTTPFMACRTCATFYCGTISHSRSKPASGKKAMYWTAWRVGLARPGWPPRFGMRGLADSGPPSRAWEILPFRPQLSKIPSGYKPLLPVPH
jgi:hypothetical protein